MAPLNKRSAMKQIIVFALLLLTIDIHSQILDSTVANTLDELIKQHVDAESPGMAVGIVQDGQVIYEHYIGYANLEHKVLIDENTRFNIASNAKQYTALCILKLSDQGKLSLDDDFRKYVPDMYENIEEKITISNLLTHTSGVRDYCDLLALTGKTWWKQFIDNGDAMELLGNQRDLNFEPGTEYLYSNSNYILLAEIVSNVTGTGFSEFAKTMFEELGMSNTAFLTNYMAVIPNKARPYGNWNGWREIPVITDVHGDGALFTTLQDQLKWEQIVQMNSGKYLSPELIDESQAPLNSSIDNNYGYGLEFDAYGGWQRSYHNGATGGYRANFSRFPGAGISVVVMTNNRDVPIDYLVYQLVGQVLELEGNNVVYPDKPETVEEFANIDQLEGIYEGEDGTIIKIRKADGGLQREIYQRNPVKLIPENGGMFYYENNQDLKMNFENIGQAEQRFTLYLSTQEPSSYIKISDLDMHDVDKTQLNGSYFNDETNTEIIIEHKEGYFYSLVKNGRERNAELVSLDYLRMMDVYKIKIIRDEQNNVVGLNVDRDRIKNVIFNKR